MRHSLPLAPQFYVTAPQPCPYLEDRVERKLFTALQGDHANILNDALSQQGFRRSQNVLYRPSCTDCNACLSARIRVADFEPKRSHKRILRKNARLRREATSPWATEAQYELFRTYLEARHADGGMADMDVFEFASMVEETPVRSRVVEYISPATDESSDEELTAVCLTDVLKDGLSMVYSFFDPAQEKSSLGTYMILDHIRIAQEAKLPFIYLGYWVPGSNKMDYKAKFGALEIYSGGQWHVIDDPESIRLDNTNAPCQPIPEQVAAISLPDALTQQKT
ncbi:MAG: arginyltransferase [Rhodobacteraceae bacterium]|nr:arginyltransferase [Paracoccaceae bacterium]